MTMPPTRRAKRNPSPDDDAFNPELWSLLPTMMRQAQTDPVLRQELAQMIADDMKTPRMMRYRSETGMSIQQILQEYAGMAPLWALGEDHSFDHCVPCVDCGFYCESFCVKGIHFLRAPTPVLIMEGVWEQRPPGSTPHCENCRAERKCRFCRHDDTPTPRPWFTKDEETIMMTVTHVDGEQATVDGPAGQTSSGSAQDDHAPTCYGEGAP